MLIKDVIDRMAIGLYRVMVAEQLQAKGVIADDTTLMLAGVQYDGSPQLQARMRGWAEAALAALKEESPADVVTKALADAVHQATKESPSILLMNREIVDVVRVHAVDLSLERGIAKATCESLGISAVAPESPAEALQQLYGLAAQVLKEEPAKRLEGIRLEVRMVGGVIVPDTRPSVPGGGLLADFPLEEAGRFEVGDEVVIVARESWDRMPKAHVPAPAPAPVAAEAAPADPQL